MRYSALLLALAAKRVSAGANTHAECAALVPQADVRRGKSAFFSGCYPATPGQMVPTGCWSPGQYTANQDQFPPETAREGYGCQTCVMTNAKFAGAVFPVYWAAGKRDHMSPCPEDEFDYAGFHAAAAIVTAASITNAAECAAGWFFSSISGRCYWKSDRFALADDWDEANTICRGMGAALVTLENAAENDWFISNLLWPGVMGETFTSLWHDGPGKGDGNWHWVTSNFLDIAPYGPGSFNDWYPGMSDATTYATPNTFTDRRSCMEIYPQVPKGWNPFSCAVNKQYACIKQGTSLAAGNPLPAPVPVPPTPAPVPVVEETDEPTPAPTPAPDEGKPHSGSTKAPTKPTGEVRYSLAVKKTGGMVAADGGWVAKDGGDAALYVLQKQLSSSSSASSSWKDVNAASQTAALDKYSGLAAGCYRVDTRPAAAALTDADALAALRWTATEAGSSAAAASGYGYDVQVFGTGGAACPTPALPACAKTCIAAAGGSTDTCGSFAAATTAGGCSGCGASDAAAVASACYRAGCGEKSCGAAPSGYAVEESLVLSLSTLVSGAALGSSPYAATVKDDLEAAVAKALGVQASATALVTVDGSAAADVFEAAARRLRSSGAGAVVEASAPRRLAAADATYVRLDFEVTAGDKTELAGLEKAVEDGAIAAPLFLSVDGFDNSAVVASDASGAKISSLNETENTGTDGGSGSSGSDDGFTSGQKVGIAVGCVAGAAVLAGAVALLATRKRRRHAMQTAAKSSTGADAPPS